MIHPTTPIYELVCHLLECVVQPRCRCARSVEMQPRASRLKTTRQGLRRRVARSDLSSAAINEQFDTCNKSRIIRRQKQRCFGNFVGLPHASHGNGGHNPRNGVCGLPIDNWSIGRPWANDVGTNMTVLEIRGPGSDEGTEGGLRCAIDAEGSRAFYARYGTVEDNRATILHQR